MRQAKSKRTEAVEEAILRLARASVPDATIITFAGREFMSCTIVVQTDEEKRRLNGDEALLAAMRLAGAQAGREPKFLSAESQQTVDRRYAGNWAHVFR